MNKKLLLLLLLIPTISHPDATCVSYTIYNLETGVTEDGPLRYVGCTCNCAQYSWLPNTTCIECGHKHGGAITLGRIQFANFTDTWLPGLMAFVKNKENQEAADKQKPFLLAEGGNYYEDTSLTGQAFDGPSIGIYNEDANIYYSGADGYDSDTEGNNLTPNFDADFGGDFSITM